MPWEKEGNNNILIADGSQVNRALLKNILEEEFSIQEAKNGMEVIEFLKKKGQKISLLLLNMVLPGLDGFAVLAFMKQQHWIEDIPVIILTAEDSPKMVDEAYKFGIIDYINYQSSPIIIKHRIQNMIRLFAKQKRFLRFMAQEEATRLENKERHQYIDKLTGCLNLEGFKLQASRILRENQGKQYIVSYGDIKKFKFINDKFGYEIGDRLIRFWARAIQKDLRKDEAVGRISADNMVVLLRCDNEEECLEKIRNRTAKVEGFFNNEECRYRIEIVIGLYKIKQEEKVQANINRMLDYANVAQKSVKETRGERIAFYTDALWEQQVREQEIDRHMKEALIKKEISVWFQPQLNYVTGKLVGAKVSARWNHPSFGWISPTEFYPVLEKSGQIYEFDQYIWENVCRYMRKWMDIFGKDTMISLSVNISRTDFYATDFYRKLEIIVDRYHIPRHLFCLEITENSYKYEPEQLIDAVARLQTMGFTVQMNDFGNSFSSLNILKDVKVDSLKMDMHFLDDQEHMFRGGMILNSVLHMAQWLEIPVIAEGVETKAQAEFLKNMGCELMQGNYFSKPLSVEEFEKKLWEYDRGKMEKDFHGDGLYHIAEFLDSTSKSSFVFNECIGGALLMEYSGNDLNILLMNDAFFEATGLDRDIFGYYKTLLLKELHKESFAAIHDALQEAVEKGFSTVEIYIHLTGRWIKNTHRCLSSGTRGHIIFVQVEDVTQVHKMSEEVRRLEQEQKWKQSMYQQLAEIPGMITYDYNPSQDELTMHISLKEGGMKTIRSVKFFDHLYEQEWLHSESAQILGNAYREALKKPGSGVVEFKGRFFGKEFRWMRSYYTGVADEKGNVYRIVGRADDIEEDVQTKISWKNLAQKDTMTNLYNHDASRQQISAALRKEKGGTLIMIDVDNFKQINDVLGHLYGDSVLKNVAKVMRKIFRKGDILGRFGGDEFIVFLPGMQSKKLAEKKANNILYYMKKIIVPELGEMKCSIGIAIASSENISAEELFYRADIALYSVKEKGKGNYAFFDPEMKVEPRLNMRTT